MKLYEITRKEIISDMDKRSLKKSKEIVGTPTYVGVTRNYSITLRVPSSANDGTYYLVKVRLTEMPDLMKLKDLTMRERVRLALAGDVAVSCTCPAYKYWGYKYIMTQLGTNIGRGENRFPVVRNPNLQGTLCKHAYIGIKYFGRYWSKIASDITNKRFIKE